MGAKAPQPAPKGPKPEPSFPPPPKKPAGTGFIGRSGNQPGGSIESVIAADMTDVSKSIDRPTCKTCPYWEAPARDWTIDIDPRNDAEVIRVHPGRCRFAAPVCGQPVPTSAYDSYCGQHPGFPAYIASLKP